LRRSRPELRTLRSRLGPSLRTGRVRWATGLRCPANCLRRQCHRHGARPRVGAHHLAAQMEDRTEFRPYVGILRLYAGLGLVHASIADFASLGTERRYQRRAIVESDGGRPDPVFRWIQVDNPLNAAVVGLSLSDYARGLRARYASTLTFSIPTPFSSITFQVRTPRRFIRSSAKIFDSEVTSNGTPWPLGRRCPNGAGK
jgi:hypothetical protein